MRPDDPIATGLALAGVACSAIQVAQGRRLNFWRPAAVESRGRLTQRAVRKGLDRLTAHAETMHADFIAGINRGGGLIGGYLAKRLRLDLLQVRVDPADAGGIRTTIPSSTVNARVLLVDDAFKTGHHMQTARQYLAAAFTGLQVASMVLLELDISRVSPGDGTPEPPNIAAYKTTNSALLLPWDPE